MIPEAWSDFFEHLRAWFYSPRRTGAIAPSSRSLARQITAEISTKTGSVIELGPGTGVFTRALLAQGVLERRLILIEADGAFVALLRHRFPKATVLHIDARRLRELRLPAEQSVGAVVSGLPILSMPPWKIIAIVSAAFRLLASEGSFYQFTYGTRCPVMRPLLVRLGLKAHRMGRTWTNFPPATVYRICRRPPIGATGNASSP